MLIATNKHNRIYHIERSHKNLSFINLKPLFKSENCIFIPLYFLKAKDFTVQQPLSFEMNQ